MKKTTTKSKSIKKKSTTKKTTKKVAPKKTVKKVEKKPVKDVDTKPIKKVEPVKEITKKEIQLIPKKISICLLTVGILLALSIILGYTYSIYQIDKIQPVANEITVGCFTINFEDSGTSNSYTNFSLTNSYPIDDEEAMSLTPYKFKITNVCNYMAKTDIAINVLKTSSISQLATNQGKVIGDMVKVSIQEGTKAASVPTVLSSFNEGTIRSGDTVTEKSYIIRTDYMEAHEEKTFNIRMWVPEDINNTEVENEAQGLTLYAKVDILSTAVDEYDVAPAPELYQGLMPVRYDKSGDTVVANTKNWYNYNEHEWANAVIVENNTVNSYDTYDNNSKVHGAIKTNEFVSFDGVDDYIDLGLANYDFGKTMSYAVKFKIKSTGTVDAIIGNWEGAGGGVSIGTTGKLSFNLYAINGGYTYAYINDPITVNRVYTVVCTADGENMKIYLDGELKTTVAFTGDIKPSSIPIALGININGQSFGDPGDVDIYQSAIYDRALSSEEIKKGFSNGIKIIDNTDLLVYDDFSNHTYHDYEKVSEDNILQYYVWIPRYRYKLFNAVAGESADEQMIDISFEDKNTIKSNGSNNGEWLTHPAFTFGNTELNGFWVGKFEPSHSDSQYINSSTNNKLGCTNENCSSASGLIIKPNQISIINNNISNYFYVSRSIENSSSFGLNSNEVDTHMMKNMEWGAVAYLSNSKYGLYKNENTCNNSDNNRSVTINGESVNRCEVWINNTHTGNHVTGYSGIDFYGGAITGCSAKNSISDSEQNLMTTCGGSEYEWNGSINNGRSSTTGNIYGIYDMSGGAWDMLMSNQSSQTNSYQWNVSSAGFTSQPDDKYYDKYLASSTSTDETQRRDQGRSFLGDAIRETMKTYDSDYGGWFGDSSRFVSNSGPWLVRGGYATDIARAGLFYHFRYSGANTTHNSFRVVMTAEDN